ncbi:hypothetical protein D3C86_1969130 [compost metagenome]
MSGSVSPTKAALSGCWPLTVLSSTLLGRRMWPELRNRSLGRILPRAMPVMSGMTHSTSWMRCWDRKSWMLGLDGRIEVTIFDQIEA